MPVIDWLLTQLPAPAGIVVAAIGVWLTGIRMYTNKTWKEVVGSRLFFLPSLITIYTFLLFFGIIGYMEISILSEKNNSVSTQLKPVFTEKFAAIESSLIVVCHRLTRQELQKAQGNLEQNLNIQSDFKNQQRPVPPYLFSEQAGYKIKIDDLRNIAQDPSCGLLRLGSENSVMEPRFSMRENEHLQVLKMRLGRRE